jgi:hypothetical protein
MVRIHLRPLVIHEIYIKHISNTIEISINNKSNLLYLFSIIKTLCNLNEFIPQSVYIVTKENNITVKTKQSLHFYRRMDFNVFLDNFEIGFTTLYTPSGESIAKPTEG